MMTVKLILALLFPALLGHLTISMFLKENDLFPLEKLAVSYSIGVGIISFIMFIMGILRLPISLLNILLVCILLFACPFVMAFKRFRLQKPSFIDITESLKAIKWNEWLMISLISIKIFYSYFEALIKPVQDIDSIKLWSLRAKVFFLEHGLSLNKANGYLLGAKDFYHYPINIPLFQTWIYNVLGSFNDVLVKVIFPTFLLSLAIIFYYTIKRSIKSRPAALFSVYLLLTLPFLIYHSTTEYMDFVVSFYFFSCFAYLLTYMRTGNRSYLIISALLAATCSLTKMEGSVLVFINIIVLIGYFVAQRKNYNKSIGLISLYISPIIIYYLPWYIFRTILILSKSSGAVPGTTDAHLNIIGYLSRLPLIINVCFHKSMFYGNWNIAWFVFIFIIIIGLIKRNIGQESISLLSCIILCVAAYGSVYLFTDSYNHLLDGTVLSRNYLTFMPLIIYYISVNAFTSHKGSEQ